LCCEVVVLCWSLNTERLQQIADYDLFIKLFLEAPFVRFRMTYLIIIIDQCIVVITQTFKVDEFNFVKTAVIIGTKQLFTSVLFSMCCEVVVRF
jgi:hypothetical protein